MVLDKNLVLSFLKRRLEKLVTTFFALNLKLRKVFCRSRKPLLKILDPPLHCVCLSVLFCCPHCVCNSVLCCCPHCVFLHSVLCCCPHCTCVCHSVLCCCCHCVCHYVLCCCRHWCMLQYGYLCFSFVTTGYK